MLQATDHIVTGWVPLHSHAFISDQPSVTSVLWGSAPVFPKAFTTVIPVSIPPWPFPSPPAVEVGIPIAGPHYQDGKLTPEQLGNMFFHDMSIQNGQPVTAGLDGLVCVVRGSANSPLLARQKAISLAQTVTLPEKQFRPDVGANVEPLLASLETLGLT